MFDTGFDVQEDSVHSLHPQFAGTTGSVASAEFGLHIFQHSLSTGQLSFSRVFHVLKLGLELGLFLTEFQQSLLIVKLEFLQMFLCLSLKQESLYNFLGNVFDLTIFNLKF